MNAAMEGRWDHGGPWEDGTVTGLLMVMGATGSRPVSSGMKPLAGTFPAAPLPSTPRTHVRTCVRGVHHLWLVHDRVAGVRRHVEVCGMHDAVCMWCTAGRPLGPPSFHAETHKPRDAATDPTGQPSGFLTGQT